MSINKLIKLLENYFSHGYRYIGVNVNGEYFPFTGSYVDKENPFCDDECIILSTDLSSLGFLN